MTRNSLDINSLCFSIPGVSTIKLCQFLFKQGGLVMYTADFNHFAWEEKAKILDMPYFYLGKY